MNSVAYKKKTSEIFGGSEDYQAIINDESNNNFFNNTLHDNTGDNPSYTDFFTKIPIIAKMTATKLEVPKNPWFEFSSHKLQPIIDEMNKWLYVWRKARRTEEEEEAYKQLKLTTKLRNIEVDSAKAAWNSHQAAIIGQLNGSNSKEAWKAVRQCELGTKCNHAKPKDMSLMLPSGERAKNDKENMSIMEPHCQRVFNNHRLVHPQALELLKQREGFYKLDDPIRWKEFITAVNSLKNDKSPGLNGVPGEAFKAMNKTNLKKVFNFIVDFWNNEADYTEWHEGQGVPVPKINNPKDPNKYRIVNLMDVCNKIFSKILTARCFLLLEKHGTKYQFGATPKSGCQEGSFTLKSLLHLRRQHNLDTFVVFADLVKAFDTSNHELMIQILEKYGAPPKFCLAIKRLYTDLRVALKIGKERADIPQTVGVRQGDNLLPVIFLFMMAAFAETLEHEWKSEGVPTAKFNRVSTTNLQEFAKGQLTSHAKEDLAKGHIFEILQILYVDDGALC